MTDPISEKYTTGTMIVDWFDKKPKEFVKAAGVLASWVDMAAPQAPPQVRAFSATTNTIKNFLGLTELPRKARDLWQSVKGLWSTTDNTKVNETAQKAIKDSCSLTNSVCDGVNFAKKFIPLSGSFMNRLGGVNNVATVVGSGIDTREQINGYRNAKETETEKKRFHCINIARNISYLILGASALFFMLSSIAVVPWLMLSLATSGLFFTIFGFFYEKMYDPEGKGKDLDPTIVIKNKIAK